MNVTALIDIHCVDPWVAPQPLDRRGALALRTRGREREQMQIRSHGAHELELRAAHAGEIGDERVVGRSLQRDDHAHAAPGLGERAIVARLRAGSRSTRHEQKQRTRQTNAQLRSSSNRSTPSEVQLDAPAGIPRFEVVEHPVPFDVAPQIHEPELVENSGAELQTGFIVNHRFACADV
jgi:hypothetical protein